MIFGMETLSDELLKKIRTNIQYLCSTSQGQGSLQTDHDKLCIFDK